MPLTLVSVWLASVHLLSELVETPTSYFRDSVQQPNDPTVIVVDYLKHNGPGNGRYE